MEVNKIYYIIKTIPKDQGFMQIQINKYLIFGIVFSKH